VYWTTCEITACVPGREFEFAVLLRDKPTNTWRYEFASSRGGVDVTDSFTLAPTLPIRINWAFAGWARKRTNVTGCG
jgi:hypothetical protein